MGLSPVGRWRRTELSDTQSDLSPL
jgi:hypothetical protein